MAEPVIICPYVFDSDVDSIRRAFQLDEPAGRSLPFFLWKDENLVGPEIAMETCWSKFPDRDIIIVHSDMAPMPDDRTNRWYEDLLGYAQAMPEAGMLACNLLYPMRSANGEWLVQSAGGIFRDGKISHIGGGVNVGLQRIDDVARPYGVDFKKVRRAEWVTFGGVYIRRAVLTACGPFDRRYGWAYVMDVDYCLEARVRGFQLFQVPVTLTHFESRTLKQLAWMTPENVAQLNENYRLFYEKWGAWLARSEDSF
jgi:hypothetical protein